MTDENVLIVQADTAEASLGWATLGERREPYNLAVDSNPLYAVWKE